MLTIVRRAGWGGTVGSSVRALDSCTAFRDEFNELLAEYHTAETALAGGHTEPVSIRVREALDPENLDPRVNLKSHIPDIIREDLVIGQMVVHPGILKNYPQFIGGILPDTILFDKWVTPQHLVYANSLTLPS
eukprot:GHVS01100520.1.p1 GENE.GHVS01100520.1~~GHVS01100520.1.p1  ORF type:complete len:133 (-),score=10.75 GHVS01100520.1:84-482(-)